MKQNTKMAIIGAGPKALAVACKAKVLSELGLGSPEIHIFEKDEIAAHWTGKHGLTNGSMSLGTSPEKDLGFPYASNSGESGLAAQIQKKMMRYSFQHYLISHDLYSDWIDKGRPAPIHRRFANYLKWVADQIKDHVNFHFHRVEEIELEADRWRLHYANTDMLFSAMMLTGPGQSHQPFPTPQSDDIVNAYDFWHQSDQWSTIKNGRIAIVGAGESAANIALYLTTIISPEVQIDIVNPDGMIHARGESFSENRLYSNPTRYRWSELACQQKANFIARTDRGVFSQAVLSHINHLENIHYIHGKVAGVSHTDSELYQLCLENDERCVTPAYRKIVLAMGFDHSALLKTLLTADSQRRLMHTLAIDDLSAFNLSLKVNHDMSVDAAPATLYLPMFAGINQGPGFANLSCLGLMSDRVLAVDSRLSKEVTPCLQVAS